MSQSLRKIGIPHHEPATTRRQMLVRGGAGFGAVALSAMLGRRRALASPAVETISEADAAKSVREPHHAPTATNVIFLFMEGGPSHLDTFDPKPLLNKLAGRPIPESFGKVITAMGEEKAPLLESKRKWKRHGRSGLWVSDWLPKIAEHADDLAVIHSCWTDGINHSGGVCEMNTCKPLGGRPSLGAWVSYGLGSENDSMPAFVVICDNAGSPVNGPRMWGTGFMPAQYQGTRLYTGAEPIPNLSRPKDVSESRQRGKLGLLAAMNRRHMAERAATDPLEARIRSYELAFRMQAEAPEAIDIDSEPDHIRRLYGMEEKKTATFGRNCLLARRLVERGVRFVQLYHGTGSKWDAHTKIESNHTQLCAEMDGPVAGLLTDLKQRGLLETTLVVWGGEFGRTPMSEKGDGRDHNPTGFTMWMAGGGVIGGQAVGATDDLGLHAIEQRAHVKDLHATILYALGLDNLRLTYLYQGQPERPTINAGETLKMVLRA